MSPLRNRARPIFVWCSVSWTAFGRKVADCRIQVPTDSKHGVRSVTVITNVKFHSHCVAVCARIIYVAYMKLKFDSCFIRKYWKYREQYTHILNYWCNIQMYTHTHTHTHTVLDCTKYWLNQYFVQSMVTEQERNKNSSIKTRDKLYLLSCDREITVSRRRQQDHSCRMNEDKNRN